MKNLKIGLAGLGVVGKSVYEILQNQKDIIDDKCKNKLELYAVSSRTKKDFVDGKIKFYENTIDLARDQEIDIIVEVIGGEDTAYELCKLALQNGKKYVTANKALLAVKGQELAQIAKENDGYIAYEASVAGAIPIIKIFKEGLSANKIGEFYAILNGTCNYILTKMKNENVGFLDALKDAQKLGYAESDPTFDIEGIDTAHKLALLAANVSATFPNFDEIYVEGITKITIDDINLAAEFGYKIKLLAIYKDGFAAVYPALVKENEKIATVDDSFNAILSKANNADYNFAVGRGAGGLPTASAIVADLIDIASDRMSFEFCSQFKNLKKSHFKNIEERNGAYFIKLILNKENGAKLAQNFLEKINARQAIYKEINDQEILCAIICDEIFEKDLKATLQNLDSDNIKNASFIRIEKTNF